MAAAQLDHPNIVPIHEFGERDGRQFYAMRWLDGGPLSGDILGEVTSGTFSPTLKQGIGLALLLIVIRAGDDKVAARLSAMSQCGVGTISVAIRRPCPA